MHSLGAKVAGGAAWMISFRFAQRGIGLISTVILARLLLPDDFGVVAMAMAAYALVQLMGEFGFDLVLIQNQQAERRHYDTAWTFRLIHGFLSAVVLAACAPIIANLFGDPRLESVMYVIAVVAVAQGLENIGIVAFRKELRFHMDFNFRIVKKLIAFFVTIALAVILGNYWALVLGILAAHVAATVLSYVMHAYRPRLSLSASRELFSFSGWVFVHSIFYYLRERGPDVLIGRLTGSASLGLYKVAYEISTLPTTELYMPIMRAVFPGFSRISHDRNRLRSAYLSVQGVVSTITFPAGIGIVVLAEPLVHLLLGRNWLAAIPLIQVIGLYGLVQLLHGNRSSLFYALGKPYLVAIMSSIQALMTLSLMGYLLVKGHDVEVAAWALVVVAAVTLPLSVALVGWVIALPATRFVAVQVRPVVATGTMAAMMVLVMAEMPAVTGPLTALLQLAVIGTVGGITYLTALFVLWRSAGYTPGAEARILEMVGLVRLIPEGAERNS